MRPSHLVFLFFYKDSKPFILLLVCVFNDIHKGYVYFGWNRSVREPGDVTVLSKAQENASSKDITVFLVETAPSFLYALSRPQYTPCVLRSLYPTKYIPETYSLVE